MERNEDWVHGYLEAEMTLSISIAYLGKDRKKKHIAIYPAISLQSSDKEYLELLHKFFGFEANITKKKNISKHKPDNIIYIIKLTSSKDVISLSQFFDEKGGFISKRKEDVFDNFILAYNEIEKIGYLFNEYSKDLHQFMQGYFSLHGNDILAKGHMKRMKDWLS